MLFVLRFSDVGFILACEQSRAAQTCPSPLASSCRHCRQAQQLALLLLLLLLLQASAEIMRLLGQLTPGCLLEKASIDEVYIDATPAAVRSTDQHALLTRFAVAARA
jgi:nucleotidyltransferase/DNA polymerase involved in DNA repair